jgi:hypothetical protein
MTAPYSLDLRERALAGKEAGETNRENCGGAADQPVVRCQVDETQARDGFAGSGSDRRLQTPHALG